MNRQSAISTPIKGVTPATAGVLQRKCACGQHEKGGKCAACRKEKQNLQRKKEFSAEPISVPEVVYDALRSPGQSLDAGTRDFLEPRFGRDFSGVRVHTDAIAAEAAGAVDALAYTVGKDVVFGAKQYAPRTLEGRLLIAHELTHVVQQGERSVIPGDLTLGDPRSCQESEADRIAGAVVTARTMQSAPQTSATSSNTRGMTSRFPGTSGTSSRFSLLPAKVIQRQLITPLAVGGGYGGLLDRDRTKNMMPVGESQPKKIKLWVNSFIPQAKIDGPLGHECFSGDNRSFSKDPLASSRTHQEVEFDLDTLAKTDKLRMGKTHEINCSTGAEIASDTASIAELDEAKISRAGRHTLVCFNASATNPLVPVVAPSIDLHLCFLIDPIARRCSLFGSRDQFPAYEAYIKADSEAPVFIYGYDPRKLDIGKYGLAFSDSVVVNGFRF